MTTRIRMTNVEITINGVKVGQALSFEGDAESAATLIAGLSDQWFGSQISGPPDSELRANLDQLAPPKKRRKYAKGKT